MDFVSPIMHATCRFCGCIRNTSHHSRHLQDNLNSLRNEMGILKRQIDDVKREVDTAERQPMRQRTEQVDGWLQRVEELEKEVDEVLQKGDEEIQKKCLKICPRNFLSSHKLGKKVSQKLQVVSAMKSEGNFSTVAVTLAWAHAKEIPLDKTGGLDPNLSTLLSLLEDDGVGIIRIHGMGGVGKTTLLKKFNNELADQLNGVFDEVIWVVVSKDLSVENVQDKIGMKLGFPNTWSSDKSQDEKKEDIFRVLKMKKFVLLLDDIWGRLDLFEVGVPLPVPDNQNKAKLAWDLFKDKVGEETLNSGPEVGKLAQDVCKECSGLPLALITIGRAMASKRTPQEWDYALSVLKKSTFKFPGEGFLDDECDNIDEASKLAYDIIGRLKLACLLLDSREYNRVNMHDVIRDMALWIVSESGRKKEKYLVQGGNLKLKVAPPISKWEKAERVFFSTNSIEELSGTPRCPKLLTLNLCNNALRTISDNFFQFMPSLKVLDMSNIRELTKLPTSFFGLLSLEHLDLSWTIITQLSIEFKSLVKLKYLYLNGMTKLDIIPLQVISSFLMLRRLEMRRCGISEGIDEGSILFGGNELLLDELECLNHLQSLFLKVKTKLALQKLLSSHKLRSCTFGLVIKLCKGSSLLQLSSLQKNIKRLEFLEISNCNDLEELSMDGMSWEERERVVVVPHKNNMWDITSIIDRSKGFHSLREVWIVECKLLKDLTWLICVPNLQELNIFYCNAMEEVIKDVSCSSSTSIAMSSREGSLSVFSRLQRLTLWALSELKSIYSHPLLFPSLIEIKVYNCPRLNKIPFHSNSGKDTLRSIQGQRVWWDKLEWENEETHSHFFPLLKDI